MSLRHFEDLLHELREAGIGFGARAIRHGFVAEHRRQRSMTLRLYPGAVRPVAASGAGSAGLKAGAPATSGAPRYH